MFVLKSVNCKFSWVAVTPRSDLRNPAEFMNVFAILITRLFSHLSSEILYTTSTDKDCSVFWGHCVIKKNQHCFLFQWIPGLSRGVKRPGRGVDHPPPSSADVEGRVELYIYSPCGPSWPVIGWPLPYCFLRSQFRISSHNEYLYFASWTTISFSNCTQLFPSPRQHLKILYLSCTNMYRSLFSESLNHMKHTFAFQVAVSNLRRFFVLFFM